MGRQRYCDRGRVCSPIAFTPPPPNTSLRECSLLDIQNAQRGVAGPSIAYYVPPTPQASNHSALYPPSTAPLNLPLPPSPAEPALDPASSRRSSGDDSRKSLQIMVETHAALTAPMTPSSQPLLSLGESGDPLEPETHTKPRYIMAEEALSILQRDVLILRNQLNFEIYLKELVQQHVGRLHHDTIVSRSEEAERQGLVRFNLHRFLPMLACLCLTAAYQTQGVQIEACESPRGPCHNPLGGLRYKAEAHSVGH